MRGTFSKGGKGKKPSFSGLAGTKYKGSGDKSRRAFQDSGLGKAGETLSDSGCRVYLIAT